MIAASIVTYNTPNDEVDRSIRTLLASPLVVRIDIIDNSRSEATRAVVESFNSERVNYIASDNVGYGAANNIAIRQSLSDDTIQYHLVMNSDIIFDSSLLTELTDLMNANPDMALTIPKVTDREGKEQSSYHRLPSPWDLICHRFVPRRLWTRRMRDYEMKVDGLTEPVNVPYVHGCFMLMRCSALQEVGLFDERFFMYPEDIDLTRRLHEKHRTCVIPWLSIVHDHRAASRHSLRMLCIHATNMLRYFRKWS